MLTPGNVLAVTQEHCTSFAQLGRERLAAVERRITKVAEFLGQRFGQYFRTEHGSDNITNQGSGGCVEHAHQQLFPGQDVGEYMLRQLQWQRLDKYEDLAGFQGEPYVYLGYLGLHYVCPNPTNMRGQWTRWQVARVRGLSNWDWITCSGEPYDTYLRGTLAHLQRLPSIDA